MKKVNVKKHPTKDLYLACYGKSTFYEKYWDEVTINSRGHVYNEAGEIVSLPFPKIFNLNETPETGLERILSLDEEYEVLDKVNGHLCILFHDGTEWINTTKGSWNHEFVNQDRELLEGMGVIDKLNGLLSISSSITFMFEIIADYDKHTLFEKEIVKYGNGENVAVLIGITDKLRPDNINSYPYLKVWGNLINAPVVEKFDHNLDEVMELFNETNTEGFVIHFLTGGLRVKVKTTEYLQLRFNKEVRNSFKKTFMSLLEHDNWEVLPEEYHGVFKKAFVDFEEYKKDTIDYYQYRFNQIASKFPDEESARRHIADLKNKDLSFMLFGSMNPKSKFIKYLADEFSTSVQDLINKHGIDLRADTLFN